MHGVRSFIREHVQVDSARFVTIMGRIRTLSKQLSYTFAMAIACFIGNDFSGN